MEERTIGQRIREVRKQKKITLIELSKLTDVAQASLSRIETGIMSGTVASHQKIAEALGISLAELYTGCDARLEEATQTNAGEYVSQIKNDISLELLTTNIAGKKMLPSVYKIAAGSKTEQDKLAAGIDRFLWVMEGSIVLILESKEYSLPTKSSLYFSASLTHSLKNSGDTPAEVLCVTSPAAV